MNNMKCFNSCGIKTYNPCYLLNRDRFQRQNFRPKGLVRPVRILHSLFSRQIGDLTPCPLPVTFHISDGFSQGLLFNETILTGC